MTGKPSYEELEQKIVTLEKEALLRRQAEASLKKSERTFRSILNASTEAILLMDLEGTVLALNDVSAQRIGREKDQLVGRVIYEFLPPEIAKARMAKSDELVRSGNPVRFEDEREGRFYEHSYYPICNSEGQVTGLAIYARDITESKRDKERLRESEERLNQAIRISKIGVFDHDHLNNTIYWSPQQKEIYGLDPDETVTLKDLINFIHPEDSERIGEAIRRGLDPEGDGLWALQFRIIRRDGSLRWLKARSQTFFDSKSPSARMVRTVGAVQDITEELRAKAEHEKLQTQLIQSHKMEAIGTLAGGIAHDFNNILSAIMGYTELAKLDILDADKIRYNLNEALIASRRAKDLVNQILAFSRKTGEARKPIQVRHLLNENLKLLRATLPPTIQIRQHVESDIGVIEADPSRIHQVIMNLCTNAAHAMREEGGVLGISLSNVTLDEAFVVQYPNLKPGRYIKLTVSDTGPGISDSIKEKIFDPYFTTKEPGEGTGLGLTIVHGIIKNYDGIINLESKPGKGSTFHVYIPVIESMAVSETEAQTPIPTGDERILLVDDELSLIDIGGQMLESLGYDVETRTSSLEALDLFKVEPNRFDLVITDMTMPHMTGKELAMEIMSVRPDIPIIIATGFSEAMDENLAKAMGIKAYVTKPIVIRNLANTIRKVLDRQSRQ